MGGVFADFVAAMGVGWVEHLQISWLRGGREVVGGVSVNFVAARGWDGVGGVSADFVAANGGRMRGRSICKFCGCEGGAVGGVFADFVAARGDGWVEYLQIS